MASLVDTYSIPSDGLLRNHAGACRYISRVGSPKTLTRSQVNHIHGMGRVVVCNFEDSATNARGGSSAGRADAEFALGQMRGLRAPAGVAVYFSVDFEIHSGFGTVDNYFDDINRIFNGTGYTVGAYGCRDLIAHLFDTHRVTYGWQCAAWSYGRVEPRAHLYQNQYCGSYDVNQIMRATYGAWTPTGAQAPLNLLEEIMALDRNSADYKHLVADIARATAEQTWNTKITHRHDAHTVNNYTAAQWLTYGRDNARAAMVDAAAALVSLKALVKRDSK